MNYVNEKHVNKSSFQLKRQGNGYALSAKYEVRENLLYNLDYVAKFERTVLIGTGVSDKN